MPVTILVQERRVGCHTVPVTLSCVTTDLLAVVSAVAALSWVVAPVRAPLFRNHSEAALHQTIALAVVAMSVLVHVVAAIVIPTLDAKVICVGSWRLQAF